jgi:hypothetical protein
LQILHFFLFCNATTTNVCCGASEASPIHLIQIFQMLWHEAKFDKNLNFQIGSNPNTISNSVWPTLPSPLVLYLAPWFPLHLHMA